MLSAYSRGRGYKEQHGDGGRSYQRNHLIQLPSILDALNDASRTRGRVAGSGFFLLESVLSYQPLDGVSYRLYGKIFDLVSVPENVLSGNVIRRIWMMFAL